MSWELRYQKDDVWSSWADISAPTNVPTVELTTTRTKSKLYDGSMGRVQPTTKYTHEDITIEWSFLSATNSLISSTSVSGLSLSAIVSGAYLVEFKTHILYTGAKTETWQGYISSFPKQYLLGMYKANSGDFETFYDLAITFDVKAVTLV